MESSSQEKTAFATHCGLYELPFGLVNMSATFQRLMEITLSRLARDGCHVYVDDVLVFSKTLEEQNAEPHKSSHENKAHKTQVEAQEV